MAIAATVSCWLSAVSSTAATTRTHRFSCALRKHYPSEPHKSTNYNIGSVKRRQHELQPKQAIKKEAVISKFPSRSSDDDSLDGRSSKKGQMRSMAFKPSSVQKKENKGVVIDSKEQQIETPNLQDADFLNAVVKVYCTHTAPDYSLPWQKQRQYTSTGSAFMIGGRKLLTNAHCVEHDTQVKVKRRGDDTKYVAKVAGP